MTQAGTDVAKAAEAASAVAAKDTGGAPESVENSRRVCCISCGRTLLEVSVDTPESRVWIKAKCRDCKTFNVIVLAGGRLNVSAVA